MQRENHFPSYEEFSRYDSGAWLTDIVIKPWRRISFLSLERVKEMSWTQKILSLMGLPAEANPARLERTPWATYGLILATILTSIYAWRNPEVFARMVFLPDAANRFLGLNFISLFFVHSGWEHLLGNMYFLFIFGDNIENRIGHFKFLLLVFCSTALATWVSFILGGQLAVPHLGASGGIFGIMVYYLLAFPRAQFTYCLFFVFFRISASTLLLIYIALQTSGALEQIKAGGGPGVDFLAHLGGALGGVLGFLYFEAHQSRRMAREFFDSVS